MPYEPLSPTERLYRRFPVLNSLTDDQIVTICALIVLLVIATAAKKGMK